MSQHTSTSKPLKPLSLIKRAAATVLAGLSLWLLTGCVSTIPVYSDQASQAPGLATYQTFAVLAVDPLKQNPSAKVSPIDLQRIADWTTAALEEKGFRLAAPETAELLIATHLTVEQRLEVRDFGYTRGRLRDPLAYPLAPPVEIDQFDEGTVVVDIIENATKRAIWRGWSTQFVSIPVNREQLRATVFAIIEQIPTAAPAAE